MLTKKLLDIGLTGVAFETVELENGELPLLAPMSVIAGKIGVQVGTHYLHQPMSGKGKLLGGLPSTERGKVVVFGAGMAGGASAALAAAGVERDGVREAPGPHGGNDAAGQQRHRVVSIRRPGGEVASADLVIGAVLVTGAVAPHVVTREMMKSMEDGSVLVDISIDRGGCFETSRPTTWRSRLRRGRGDPFLRDQHARRRAADLLAGDLRGDPAVGQASWRPASGAITPRW